jgi:fibronectin-binding autotransporter adhesin
VNGAGYLNATGVIAGSAYSLTKDGTGELRLAGSNTYGGGTIVNQGILRVTSTGSNVLKNILTVGNGVDAAEVIIAPASGAPGTVANNSVITVNTNATLSLNAPAGGYYLETFKLNGGTLDLGGGVVALYEQTSTTATRSFTMDGGTVRNGTLGISGGDTLATLFSTVASSKTSTISSNLSIGGYQVQMDVADGAAAIDLDVSGAIIGNIGFRKLGAGVMALSKSDGSTVVRVGDSAVAAGTVLANNQSGSAFGNTRVVVNAGGTLGGTGFIGGVLSNGTSAANANVTLTGTLADGRAVLSPGSVNATGSASIIGMLTVGDATQNNNVTFANYSTLLAQVGNAGSSDLLTIVGNLSLASTSNQDALAILPLTGATPSGTYTLATFTGTLTGRFDAVTFNGLALPTGYELRYLNATGQTVTNLNPIAGGGSIVFVTPVLVPEPGAASLALGSAAIGLLRRRRLAAR